MSGGVDFRADAPWLYNRSFVPDPCVGADIPNTLLIRPPERLSHD